MARSIKLREPGKRAFCKPAQNSSSGDVRSKFKLIKSTLPERSAIQPDPELKELLDELNSRNENARAARAGRTRTLLDDIDEGPEAA